MNKAVIAIGTVALATVGFGIGDGLGHLRTPSQAVPLSWSSPTSTPTASVPPLVPSTPPSEPAPATPSVATYQITQCGPSADGTQFQITVTVVNPTSQVYNLWGFASVIAPDGSDSQWLGGQHINVYDPPGQTIQHTYTFMGQPIAGSTCIIESPEFTVGGTQ
jgi:hypothetical protein